MNNKGWAPTIQNKKAELPPIPSLGDEVLVDIRISSKDVKRKFEDLIGKHPRFMVKQAKYEDVLKPELIIIEPDYDHYSTFSYINSVRTHDTGPEIFLTAFQPDMNFMVEALRAGVRELFLQPIQDQEVWDALDRCAARLHARNNSSDKKMGKENH